MRISLSAGAGHQHACENDACSFASSGGRARTGTLRNIRAWAASMINNAARTLCVTLPTSSCWKTRGSSAALSPAAAAMRRSPSRCRSHCRASLYLERIDADSDSTLCGCKIGVIVPLMGRTSASHACIQCQLSRGIAPLHGLLLGRGEVLAKGAVAADICTCVQPLRCRGQYEPSDDGAVSTMIQSSRRTETGTEAAGVLRLSRNLSSQDGVAAASITQATPPLIRGCPLAGV